MRVDELEPLLSALVGERVTAKRIAGNSISLWFAVPSNSGDARGIWFEPPWRIEGVAGVETSSFGFPHDQEEGESIVEYRRRFENACARSDSLNDAILAAVDLDFHTGDLALHFADGRVLRSFTTDTEWENWHYADHGAGRKYRVLGTSVRAEVADA